MKNAATGPRASETNKMKIAKIAVIALKTLVAYIGIAAFALLVVGRA